MGKLLKTTDKINTTLSFNVFHNLIQFLSYIRIVIGIVKVKKICTLLYLQKIYTYIKNLKIKIKLTTDMS